MDLTADYPSLPPLYVAANGCAYRDVQDSGSGSADGSVADDVERIAYLNGSSRRRRRAVADDVERIAYLNGHLAAVAVPWPPAATCAAISTRRSWTAGNGPMDSPGISVSYEWTRSRSIVTPARRSTTTEGSSAIMTVTRGRCADQHHRSGAVR